jgi:hypothetical protein
VPPFPRPAFAYDYDSAAEIAALRRWRTTKPGRQIPPKRPDRLLVATWNIANLGVQDRGEDDYALIAAIVGWFDLIAVQEVNDNLKGLRGVLSRIPRRYRALYSDAAGNDERLAFLYDSNKLALGEEIGEIAVPPSEARHIRLPGITQAFAGFDRNPYLATFTTRGLGLSLVKRAPVLRLRLDALQEPSPPGELRGGPLGRPPSAQPLCPHHRRHRPGRLQPAQGRARRCGLRGAHRPGTAPADHSTQIASSIASESHYDQVAFFPGETAQEFVRSGVFDFDGAVFADLWAQRGPADFQAYVRYHLSDHRPLWAQFRM